jgi:hypothetical protein
MTSSLPVARRAVRLELDAAVSLTRTMGTYNTVALRDLSTHGCSVELVDRVSLDEALWIKFPGSEARQGLVCWVKDFVCGVEFDSPFHGAVSDLLISRMNEPF